MVVAGFRTPVGRLAIVATVIVGVAYVASPCKQAFAQFADSEQEKAAPPDAKPQPPTEAEKPAKRLEPLPTWLQGQDMSGSSPESERAVDAALSWLAEHQYPNGGWSFDHRLGGCKGRCSNPGTLKAVNGATGMALLPFIDHGSTHQTGPYQQNVAAGLQFLIARMTKDGSLWEPGGTMYSHALGLLALCGDLRIDGEASGHSPDYPSASAGTGKKGPRPAISRGPKTTSAKIGPQTTQQRKEQQARDLLGRQLSLAASKALSFALASQDRHGGGWRYDPRRPNSDISVTGWHVMALHSAEAINLPIPAWTPTGVTGLLNFLEGNYGATYGYHRSPAEATPTRTAIGLLCRVYTGWNRAQLQRGVETLASIGPSESDMYYDYYGTLLLHHYGGPLWDAWNSKLRDYLIRTQSHDGHESGSWSFAPGRSNAAGGRHFDTCMACLILETYYRSKPAFTSPHELMEKPADQPAAKANEVPAKLER